MTHHRAEEKRSQEKGIPTMNRSFTEASLDAPLDICGFTEMVPLSAPDSSGMVRVPPSHPHIRYGGRIDCTNPEALRFSHVGASFRIRFEGDSLEMLLKDFGAPGLTNYYNIIVDGGAPVILGVFPEIERFSLAKNLGAGPHTVEVFKRVENGADSYANNGKGIFKGFLIPEGSVPLPLLPRPRRVEFIGDSITCGYGNGISTETPEYNPYTTENADGYQAFGAVVARALDAEYMAVAYSGRGVVRNYAGVPGKTLPEMYLDILPDDKTPGRWDVTRYTPELLVINLGTNDFSEGVTAKNVPELRQRYAEEYALFLDTLRGFYPNTVFILAIGPLLSDDWPPGINALSSVQQILERLVADRREAGDADIHLIRHQPQSSPYGEDWHPTAARHRIMADELLAFIEKLDSPVFVVDR
jgi:lysophospholipase L1-like esterase